MTTFIREKNKLVSEMKKKMTRGFIFQKYAKYWWSVSLGHFIKHKPLISVEWPATMMMMIFDQRGIRGHQVARSLYISYLFRPYSIIPLAGMIDGFQH